MIPIECPKCGREGNVPADRLNARLVCKACHSPFHMDAGGRMVLGDPAAPGQKQKQPRGGKSAEVDLAQTWNDIPKAVKFGVPGFVLAIMLWQFGPFGGGASPHQARAEGLIRALAANDRARALSYASPMSAEPAGKWFDLMRTQMDKKKIDPTADVSVSVFSGNPEKDTSLTLWCVAFNKSGSDSSVPVNFVMNLDGGTWKLDGDRSLKEGEKSISLSSDPKRK